MRNRQRLATRSMFSRNTCAVAVLFVVAVSSGLAQDSVRLPQGPVFDVVSIRLSAPLSPGTRTSGGFTLRPDGGITMTGFPVIAIIPRAYANMTARDIVGLPDWASTERYDVIATASLRQPPTMDERFAMLRAMLADRLKLVAHFEKRQLPVFDLVVARDDRKLGPGLTPIEADCDAKQAALAAGTLRPEAPDFSAPPSPCSLRMVGARPPAAGDRLEGETSMANLAQMLLLATAGPRVVDKTGLRGSYRVALVDFDMRAAARPPEAAPPADAPPSVFTALREQLGLKLEPSRAEQDVLVIDHIERPSDN